MEDYIYEIMGVNDEVIESDYACLDTAIEFAEENGGAVINMLWFPTDENGDIDYGAEVIASNTVWERESSCETDKISQ